MKQFLTVLAFLVLLTPAAFARDLYVRSTDGSDADDGLTWATARATLQSIVSIATRSDTVWVSDNHAESAGAAKTITFPTSPGLRVLCGDDAAEPPTALATTCSVTTTGNFAVTFVSGYAYVYGITFSSGTGNSGASDLSIGTATNVDKGMIFDTCVFNNLSTSTSAVLQIGPTSSSTVIQNLIRFINPTFKFGSTATTQLQMGRIEIINMAIDATGATPTTLFTPLFLTIDVLIQDSDLSGEAFTNLLNQATAGAGIVTIRNCKLPAAATVVTGTHPGPGGMVLKMHNVDNADTNYRFAEHSSEGSVVQETTIVRTGGASDGTTPLSWKMTAANPADNSGFWHPLESPEIVQWNETTGSALTATVEFVWDSTVNATNTQIWLETDCLATSGFPQGTRSTDRKADILAAAADQTDSTATWTTTGLTDPNTQKLETTCTPAEKGFIHARVYVSGPLVAYVDPLMTIAP